MQQQCLATLIVAQLLQGMRLQMAQEAGVDAFAVSLPLLVEVLPEVLMDGWEPMRYGVELRLIRPSSRLEPVVPEVREEEMVMPAGELAQRRKARYPRYVVVEEGEEGDATISKTGTAKKRANQKKKEREKTGEKSAEGREKKKGEKGRKRKKTERKEWEERKEGSEEKEGGGKKVRRETGETRKRGEAGREGRDQKKQEGKGKAQSRKETVKEGEKSKIPVSPPRRETTHISRIVPLVDT